MFRAFLALLASSMATPGATAQCTWSGPNPFVPVEILTSAIGQRGFGSNGFWLRVYCDGLQEAHVKLKLDTSRTINSGLIFSPSTGITPFFVEVGVDPAALADWFPIRHTPQGVYFTTVDLSPPLTASLSVRVTLVNPYLPAIESVVNAASFAPVVTPGAVVLIRGTSLGPFISHQLGQTGLYPASLGNTTVTFNGIPAPLISSSPLVLKAVAPYTLSGQTSAQVVLTRYQGTTFEQVSEAFTVPVAENSLAIYSRSEAGAGQGDFQNCDADGCKPNSAENPAAPGSIITFFATGLTPPAAPLPDGAIVILARLTTGVSLTIGGQPAQLLYFGAAPYQVPGVLQVNARIPQGLGPGPQPVVLTVGDSNNAPQKVTVCLR